MRALPTGMPMPSAGAQFQAHRERRVVQRASSPGSPQAATRDLAVHLGRLAEQHVHRHVDGTITARVVFQHHGRFVGGDAVHRVGGTLVAAHLVEQPRVRDAEAGEADIRTRAAAIGTFVADLATGTGRSAGERRNRLTNSGCIFRRAAATGPVAPWSGAPDEFRSTKFVADHPGRRPTECRRARP